MKYEVVYNACYGGFGLSDRAIEMYRSMTDMDSTDNIYPSELDRHDPVLVQVVKILGSHANGGYSELMIAEINGPQYLIDEYDGYESVITPDTKYDWVVIDPESSRLDYPHIKNAIDKSKSGSDLDSGLEQEVRFVLGLMSRDDWASHVEESYLSVKAGKTTDILISALCTALQGYHVMVIGHTRFYTEMIEQLFREMEAQLRVVIPEIPILNLNVDITTMECMITFTDHSVG